MLQETGLEEWMGADTQIEKTSGFIGEGTVRGGLGDSNLQPDAMIMISRYTH